LQTLKYRLEKGKNGNHVVDDSFMRSFLFVLMPVVIEENMSHVKEWNRKVIHIPSDEVFFQSFKVCTNLIYFYKLK
jgi:hypothetical protein